MTRDEVLLLSGRLLGMLSRLGAEEIERAANSPGLFPGYKALLLELARLRRQLARTPAR